MTTIFRVPDASCGHCKTTIEGAVADIDGVQTADLNLDSKELRVEHDDDVTKELMAATIAGVGYSPEEA